ncbi:hypothetical protein RI367_007731 [Sorochytrium milnesiophthora]
MQRHLIALLAFALLLALQCCIAVPLSNTTIRIGQGCTYNVDDDNEWCVQMVTMMRIHRDYLQTREGVLSNYNLEFVPYNLSFDPFDAVHASQYFLSQNVLGVIGYGYQSLISPGSFSLAAQGVSMCDGVSVSATSNDKTVYPTFFRTCADETQDNDAVIRLLLYNNWTSIAFMYEDDSAINNAFLNNVTYANITLLDKEKVAVPQSTVPSSAYDTAMQNIKQSGALIIVFNSYSTHIVPIVQSAQMAGMWGAPYAWIACGGFPMDAVGESNATGLIYPYPQERYGPVADDLYAIWQANKSTVYGYSGNYDPWAGAWFYATCAELFMRRIDAVLRQSTDANKLQLLLNGNYSALITPQSLYTAAGDNMTPTGTVRFSSTGSRLGRMLFYNVQANGRRTAIGGWDPDNGMVMTAPAVYPGNVTAIPRAVIPPAEIATWAHYDSPGGIILIMLNMLGTMNVAGVAYVYTKYKQDTIIRRSSPRLAFPMLLGILLGHLSIFSTYGKPTAGMCIFDMWVIPVAFSLIFANLIVKSYRIYRIFTISGHIKPMKDSVALSASFTILAVQMIILAVWTIVDPSLPLPVATSPGQYVWTCQSQRTDIRLGTTMPIVLYVYNGLWLLVGVVLAYLTRNLPSDFQEAKYISLSAFTIALVSCFTVPVLRVATLDPDLVAALRGLSVYVCLLTVNLLIFGPRMYAVVVPGAKRTVTKFGDPSQIQVSGINSKASRRASAASKPPQLIKSVEIGRSTELHAAGVHVARVSFRRRRARLLELSEPGLLYYSEPGQLYAHVILRLPKHSEQQHQQQSSEPPQPLPVDKFQVRQGYSWCMRLGGGGGGGGGGDKAKETAGDAHAARITHLQCNEATLTIEFRLAGMQRDRQWMVVFADKKTFDEWQSLYSA